MRIPLQLLLQQVINMRGVSLIPLFAFIALAHAAPTGLVPNGDFELEDGGTLAAWMPFGTVPDAVPNNVHGVAAGFFDFVWDQASDDGGAGSLLIRGRGTRLPVGPGVSPLTARGENLAYIVSPKIPVRENAEYQLTYSIKTAGMADPQNKGQNDRLAFEIRFYTGNGKPGYGAHKGRIPNRTGKENDKQLSVVDTPTHSTDIADWQHCEATIKIPASATDLEIRVRAICNRPFFTFSSWIDNVRLVPVGQEIADVKPADTWHPRTKPSTERGLATGDFEFVAPPVPFGSRIQRTMKLLATSTPQCRHKVRILCYGQSIMAQAWWRILQADLVKRFPHADLEMVNLSLGGFMSNDLLHSAELDMIPFYPDLVLMHDYLRNGPDELNRLYGGLHHRTTAEMLTLTHHFSFPATEAMFKGTGKAHGREAAIINDVASAHSFEVVQIRDNWRHLYRSFTPARISASPRRTT